MKRFLVILLFIAVAVFVGWKFVFKKDDKPSRLKDQPIAVSKHSESFNQSMMKAMDAYYALTESFVNWDTAKVNSSITTLKVAVDSIRIPEMQKDSAIYETAQLTWDAVKSEIAGMQMDTSLYEKREALNMLTENLFALLRVVKYDVAKVYYHECPMALNNNEASAFWLSTDGNRKNLRNPYLGLHDPKYGKSMLTCGSTRDSINFVVTPTGK